MRRYKMSKTDEKDRTDVKKASPWSIHWSNERGLNIGRDGIISSWSSHAMQVCRDRQNVTCMGLNPPLSIESRKERKANWRLNCWDWSLNAWRLFTHKYRKVSIQCVHLPDSDCTVKLSSNREEAHTEWSQSGMKAPCEYTVPARLGSSLVWFQTGT